MFFYGMKNREDKNTQRLYSGFTWKRNAANIDTIMTT